MWWFIGAACIIAYPFIGALWMRAMMTYERRFGAVDPGAGTIDESDLNLYLTAWILFAFVDAYFITRAYVRPRHVNLGVLDYLKKVHPLKKTAGF